MKPVTNLLRSTGVLGRMPPAPDWISIQPLLNVEVLIVVVLDGDLCLGKVCEVLSGEYIPF